MKPALEPIRRFVYRHKLHSSVPVSLRALQVLHEVRTAPFSGATMGFGFAGKTKMLIGINEAPHPFEQRMVFAHEFSYGILRHPNSFFLCQINAWLYNRLELEAQRGAALMLLPLRPLRSLALRGWSLTELQNHFEVPAQLVELRLEMARRYGQI